MEPGVESSAAFSLLSLSIAAPIPVPSVNSQPELPDSLLFGNGGSFGGSDSNNAAPHSASNAGGSVGNTSALKHHRRLSSTGKTRRRLSDARDAASRPSPASLSLSGLSLNSPPQTQVPLSTSFTTAVGSSSPVNISGDQGQTAYDGLSLSVGSPSGSVPGALVNGTPPSADGFKTGAAGSLPAPTLAKPVPIVKNGKKRGMDHKCESCNKVYRHPSCLIKHRWEHTPHWRESSKYVLSKHQQVQLLEAAAILSHFSPDSATGTSLPEDRSLWPSFLSGGTLPLPEGSSSVPNNTIASSTRATSTGPRLHNYAIVAADAVKVRPGLVVANGNATSAESPSVTGSTPIPVPNGTEVYGYGYGYGRTGGSSASTPGSRGKSWGDRSSSPRRKVSGSVPRSTGVGGTSLSLPRSSLRSGSSSSASGSGGRSGSSELDDEDEAEDEEDDNDVDVDIVDVEGDVSGRMRYPYEYDTGVKVGMKPMKEEEEDWEMEMDMD
ncbi:hypothetical protein E1B28_006092 [Marasmius oreades]|uniref:C2H2-type domain-containing protein n=1 Tax=Marasmius oreades TaxID=181124 RepID=A0A9P7UUX4_9AGAR|nr:uncharacterized protein E1B28_006092 [Marasmius oreades]KAG7095327.1 hypothetical protein E1B28_006092 [Marasmius oreades]